MTTIINGSSPSITFSDGSAQTSATRPFLNRIINGAMVIDQRNAGASVTLPNGAAAYSFVTDRWACSRADGATATGQQSSTAPTGFINSLLITNGTGITVASTAEGYIYQPIEGFNIADLGWGTANAKTVTLSFWVRSSITGTHSGSLSNSANNRCYAFSYTISSANTWEQKSVTVAGDTSGTWLTTNGRGINLFFNNGAGSNFLKTGDAWGSAFAYGVTGSVALNSVTGSTWFVTGVQLEVGSTATSFDYRPYGTELQLCQRYYQVWRSEQACCGRINGTTQATVIGVPLSTAMRTTPTFSSGNYNVWQGGSTGSQAASSQVATASTYTASSTGLSVTVNGFSGRTDDLLAVIIPSFGNNIGMSAEL